MKPFSQWSKEEVEEEFGLYADHSYWLLQEWIAVLPSVSDEEQRILRRLSQKLLTLVHDWNEEELKVFFVAFILDFIDFWQPHYRPFSEQMVAAQKANPDTHPIYGAYIIGRHWYSVLLDGQVHAESLAYDATKDEIMTVVGILRQTKDIIDGLIQHFPRESPEKNVQRQRMT